MEPKKRSICSTTVEMLKKAGSDGTVTAFDRSDALLPCPIGSQGNCCKICAMGPCRVSHMNEEGQEVENCGVCGATPSTIAARNFLRMIAAGASAHSDHGRAVAEVFNAVAHGEGGDYEIKDVKKLYQVAMDFGIEIDEKSTSDLAKEIGALALKEFGKQEGQLNFIKKAPLKRQKLWEEKGVIPRGVDREIVEALHRTHMGVDQDYKNIIMHGARTSLADGWGGSMIATELQDILFGTPHPLLSKINLGVLKSNKVNVVVHGHEPILSEMIVQASKDEEINELVREKGADGINIAGICCTANEILMRHGIPIAGNFLQQELALVTGSVDAMVVDVQCIMQSLESVANCYHTKLITTSPRAKMTGVQHMEFDEHQPLESAKAILREAAENFPNRKAEPQIPQEEMDLVAGFSHETINYLLGGVFRASYRPLNENIINGRIRGVAGVVGCNNPRVVHDSAHITLIKELLKNDVLVLQTGCSAMAAAKAGLLVPEAAKKFAGEGLAEVCETVGIPPVIHMGSCVDNSRILMAATALVKEGGLGEDLSDLPAAGAAPEWMSEKAIAIGQYFVSSGVYTVLGATWPTLGNQEINNYLFENISEDFGGKWAFEPDPKKMAQLILNHIDAKRKELKIDKARDRVLYDMDMRREMASQ